LVNFALNNITKMLINQYLSKKVYGFPFRNYKNNYVKILKPE